MLSLRKPVPAILAFISHFGLRQLNLRTGQVHFDGLMCLKKLHSIVCLKLHFSKERKGFKSKQEMDLFWTPGTF